MTEDYIYLSDMSISIKNCLALKERWLKNTAVVTKGHEGMHSSEFNRVGFDTFKIQVGLNSFMNLPVKWIELTDSKIIIKTIRKYGVV